MGVVTTVQPQSFARHAVLHTLAAAVIAVALALGMTGTALAADLFATGLDFTGNGGILDAVSGGKVDAVEVSGQEGDTVFVTVKEQGEILVRNLPCTLGQNGDGSEDSDDWHGLVTLDLDSLDAAKLEDGGYEVLLYSDRRGKQQIYDGILYGVYAQIDGKKQLIGTRTASASEAGRGFNPPSTLYVGGVAYTTDGKQVSSTPAYTYIYSKGSAAGAKVQGIVHFVYADADGASHEITAIKQMVGKNGLDVAIPETVADADGARYRTIFSQDAVTLQNPGALAYTIYCAKLSRDDSGNYLATIRMADTDGNLIASDKVEVRGYSTYTTPKAIYKTETVDGVSAVVAYTRVGDGVVDLSAAAVREAKGATVSYKRQEPESAAVEVTFNLLDGTKEPGAKGRTLGVYTQDVSQARQTATPPATVRSNGDVYRLAGNADDYAYTYRSGAMPVVNAYYTPEGNTPDSAYAVTVNYVNYANGKVLDTQELTSGPDDQGPIEIDAPSQFRAKTDTYVKLSGQDGLLHSYYSGVKRYTVYYRNADDTLTSGVTRVRVVYDAPASTGNGTTAATQAGSSQSGQSSSSGSAAGGQDGADARLNQEGTYSSIDGENGNGTLSNEEGTDSATERIDEEYPPLSDYDDEPQSGIDAGVVAAVAAALAAVVGILVFLLRRRRDDEAAQAQGTGVTR